MQAVLLFVRGLAHWVKRCWQHELVLVLDQGREGRAQVVLLRLWDGPPCGRLHLESDGRLVRGIWPGRDARDGGLQGTALGK